MDQPAHIRESPWAWPAIAVAFASATVWLYISGAAMLDDALIHLRYADFLLQTHRLTYDGVHTSFGVSSLLWVAVLAVLRGVSASPLLPKFASAVCFLALLVCLSLLIARLRRNSSACWLAIALLLAFAGGMGVRWLADGMETALTVLLAFIAGWAAAHPPRKTLAVALIALGALLVFARIELALMVALAAAAMFFTLRGRGSRLAAALMPGSCLAIGGIAALILIHAHLGVWLPDTAAAKAGIPRLQVLRAFATVTVGGLSLGIGLSLVWLVSAVFAARVLRGTNLRLAWLAANAGLPVVLLLAMVRGQAVQGLRYFLTWFVFATVWNLFVLRDLPDSRAPRVLHYAGAAICALILVLWVAEAVTLPRVLRGRASELQQMQSAHLDIFTGQPAIARDVGFIGYFSRANICDLGGLINGRAMAQMTPEQRAAVCWSKTPAFVYLSDYEIKDAEPQMNLQGWVTCRSFTVPNVQGDEALHLMVPPASAALCASLNAGR